MPENDIRSLVNRLDRPCQVMLDKAARFCVGQHHAEVTVEHLLLQMLDQGSGDLNRLLDSQGVDPLDWIQHLLRRLARIEQRAGTTPRFSQGLVEWLQRSARADGEVDTGSKIGLGDLIETLLCESDLARGLELPDLGKIDTSRVAAGTNDRDSPDGSPSVTPSDFDATLVIQGAEAAAAASPSPSPSPDRLRIAGYDQLERIGEGGMAVVYRARHVGLDRQVAIKVLNQDVDSGTEFTTRFLREARIIARLAHPNIVQIYDVNEVEQRPYIAMEFAGGGELSLRMKQGFGLDETIDVLSQILAALEFAHAQGCIHRDIKPGNILFRDTGSVALTDFGIARLSGEDSDLTVAGSVLGTPRYMSPEQARSETVDPRADLYSVGVLAFQMLQGRLPYSGESAIGTAMMHVLDPIPRLTAPWECCQEFIDKAMAKRADQRFQSAGEMAQALVRLGNG